ncbi:MAG: patatin-like phospholipase family protein [Burkholderiales bacterium]
MTAPHLAPARPASSCPPRRVAAPAPPASRGRAARVIGAACLAISAWLPAAAAAATEGRADGIAREPRTCVVLSGGGARGYAHIGVLKWLEAHRVPIDCIVGTSMGAVIGGLYASGVSIERIEAAMRATDWSELRGPDAPRPMRPPRRLEEDYEYTVPLELRLQGFRTTLPSSVFGGARFEQRLRAWLGARPKDEHFDALPIPFRAIATRLGTGEVRVLERGDLALAIRASMSVPGLFEPTRIDGGLFVDGGLVANLPVDVAHALGAERVIAVNVGTGLADESTLDSLVDVSVQTLAILTEQNVRAQLTRLRPDDVLVSPPLEGLTFLDFQRVAAGVDAGTRGAEAQRGRLLALATSPERPARLDPRRAPLAGAQAGSPGAPAPSAGPSSADAAAVTAPATPTTTNASTASTPSPATTPGTDPTTAIASSARSSSPPDTVRFGLSVGTDLTTGSFRLNVGHRHLSDGGSEWRNQLELGRLQRLGTDLFLPFDRRGLVALVPYAEVSRQTLPLYVSDRRISEFLVERLGVGLDAGVQTTGLGELRIGPLLERVRVTRGENGLLDFSTGDFVDTPDQLATFAALRVRYRHDTLDVAFLPRAGSRLNLDYIDGITSGVDRSRYQFGSLEAQWFGSVGRDTFEVFGQWGGYIRLDDVSPRWFTLGGFHRLSGYALDRFSGTDILFGRLQWRRSIGQAGALGDRLWVGATLEAGRITDNLLNTGLPDGPTPIAASLFVASETPLGPLYFGLGLPRDGGPRAYLFLGRP